LQYPISKCLCNHSTGNNNTNMPRKGEDPSGRIYCCNMVDRGDNLERQIRESPHPHSKALRDAPAVHVKNENQYLEPTLIRLDPQPTYQPTRPMRHDSPPVMTTVTPPAKKEEDVPTEIITVSARKEKKSTLLDTRRYTVEFPDGGHRVHGQVIAEGVFLESRGGVICVKGLSFDSIFRKSALKEGLEIVAINSESTTGKTLQEVANLIYETEGTLVIQAKEIYRAPIPVTANKENKTDHAPITVTANKENKTVITELASLGCSIYDLCCCCIGLFGL